MCMHYRLPLGNLNTFAAAAERESFQEAAESLYVTPSAVSHQIRNLEKLLGYRLFDRLDKKVRLTPRGEKLFNDIRAPIRELHEASRQALRGLQDKTLALSVAPVFATGWLLPRLKDFYASYPDISLSVIATTDLVDFNTDPFDASIRMGKGDWENIYSCRLFDAQTVAVCHPAMLQQNEGLFTPAELTGYPLIHNSSMSALWDEWFQSAGIKTPSGRAVKLQVQSSAQVVEVLQSGDCIGLIDRNFISKDISSGRLAVACGHIFQGEVGYFLSAPESAETLPSLQCFKDWLTMQLTEHGINQVD